MAKSAAETSKRLMNLLYNQTASQISITSSSPRILKQLNTDTETNKGKNRVIGKDEYSSTSLLDDPTAFALGINNNNNNNNNNYNNNKEHFPPTPSSFAHLRKTPAKQALVNCWPKYQSNILSFRCPNLFVTKQDFQNILPRERYQSYDINPKSAFEVIKRREGELLTFCNEYFLVFKNQISACVYIMETSNKLINGVPLKLNFEPLETITQQLVPEKLRRSNYEELIKETTLSKTSFFQLTENDYEFPNYKPILKILDIERRERSVLVHNWPFGLMPQTFHDYFRNYNLDPKEPKTVVHSDISKEINSVILTFSKKRDALRFTRNFHGKHWLILQDYSVTNEKVFSQPILCEDI